MRLDEMKVERRLNEIIDKDGVAHLTLIDPDSQNVDRAAEIAADATASGTDAIMIGGSVGAGGSQLDQTLLAIKKRTDLPTILFPSGVYGLSKHADAVFFMSLLNSRNVTYITTHQALGAPIIKRYELEPIPMAYLLIHPGGTAAWIGDAKPIPREKPELAVAYALAAKYLGMRWVYLEAGSGVDEPVPTSLIQAVKESIGDTKVIVGGGIRDGTSAEQCAKAGADVIVTGTVVEEENAKSKIEEIVRAIKE
ncbi:MAG: geranylgeranylglyceryl/heptaprenylglyceryl phosphate synthase [Methanocellales archaeon]|nr:geranylgeranylglyceryl/heptaprenylglyceryl phosphate synthase [Methanocellales archaeon]MDD3291301.1 geranylgeranylglyceryl/heptaprenylglyceryl phosphate synthase [Methanocellales archaeon]MDD5235473.1 geranylgeranylglyceryl/heptaprenylglyceryl phosphate synthase [Methanocellales archaeon]MDD5484444.1 geranylgeranylglyceryl/heptaprenylglyceryl phosphate synthase [Methanocellales archaeon]